MAAAAAREMRVLRVSSALAESAAALALDARCEIALRKRQEKGGGRSRGAEMG